MYKKKKIRQWNRGSNEKIPISDLYPLDYGLDLGSIYEAESQNGLSHFIEHMLFKVQKSVQLRI